VQLEGFRGEMAGSGAPPRPQAAGGWWTGLEGRSDRGSHGRTHGGFPAGSRVTRPSVRATQFSTYSSITIINC
jgi:hypothetical protein